MKLNERQTEIVRLIQRLKRLEVSDLANRFGISAVTIRKDLDYLEKRGILQRTHGGAILAENVEKTITVERKLGRMVEAKKIIAQYAFDQIFNCETIALDSGSTTLALARVLKSSPVTLITNSLLIAQELSGRDSGSLILLGGIWRKETLCFMGPPALQQLDRLNIDMAFVGASGYSRDSGFTCQNSLEAQVKEKFLKRAERKFIIADSSKYGNKAFSTFAGFNDVDGLIVDEGLSQNARKELTEAGLHIITAQKKSKAGRRK